MMRFELEKLNLPGLPCKERASCLECEVLCPHKKPVLLPKDQAQLEQMLQDAEIRVVFGILAEIIMGGIQKP